MNEDLIRKITREIVSSYCPDDEKAVRGKMLPVAVSGRHIHVSEAEFRILFGDSASLSRRNDLSQPGQFACNETVTLVGPKDVIRNVRILGPFRDQTQVEISATDAVKLGVKPPVRDSGDLTGSCGMILTGPAGAVTLSEGVILAVRHIHFTPGDAARFGVSNKQKVRIRTFGERSLIFGDVLCRVSDSYALEMHLDTDEGNAALLKSGDLVELLA